MFMNKNEVLKFFEKSHYRVINYSKNDIIALEGSPCINVGLVLKGGVDIKRILTSNSVIHLSSFNEGDFFGEVIAFSDTTVYPATVIASSDSKVMFITKNDFIGFCSSHPDFLEMFLNTLTNKIIVLNQSITGLSLTSIRQKISNYLLSEYDTQGSIFININMTKQKLSEKLGIPRPSLSRELINMKNEGILDYSKNVIKILNIDFLRKVLME